VVLDDLLVLRIVEEISARTAIRQALLIQTIIGNFIRVVLLFHHRLLLGRRDDDYILNRMNLYDFLLLLLGSELLSRLAVHLMLLFEMC